MQQGAMEVMQEGPRGRLYLWFYGELAKREDSWLKSQI